VITAVDSNVLLDVFTADARHGVASRDALRRCRAEGSLVACEIVWAEVAAAFGSLEGADAALRGLDVVFDALDAETASRAGLAWRRFRSAGGARRRTLPDLLIGQHATDRAERLLTRDRGFYRSTFSDLAILDPSSRR
jgi:predicted nucleic acid-binding protein